MSAVFPVVQGMARDTVIPGWSLQQRNDLPQDADDTRIEEHCPRVSILTYTSKWTSGTHGSAPKFSVCPHR